MQSMTSKRSGRRPIPVRWTRIISIDDLDGNDIKTFPINDDLDVEYELPKSNLKKRSK